VYHYVVSALLACGQRKQAMKLIEECWGAMVAHGTDTFWEVFDPAESLTSPYEDVHINSFCHAWSCTRIPAAHWKSCLRFLRYWRCAAERKVDLANCPQ